MSKKVLIISSSPRKGGNSDTLCDKFMEGAKSAGNEVEKIMEGKEFPEVLDSVLQPHVEFYKKNLKGGVVVPGRISK